MAQSYLTLDWATIHRDSCLLAEKVAKKGPWKGIVAVTRGGMIPAAIIARELTIRLIETVSVATYNEETRGQPNLLKPPVAAGDGEGFLIVDDLVDSGVTAKHVRSLLPRAHLACLYAKPEGEPQAHDWIKLVDQDVWIVFPWDVSPLKSPEQS